LYLLQTEMALVKDAVEGTGLRGWSQVALYALVVVGFVVLRLIMPKLIKRESQDVVSTISREEVQKVIAENELLLGENNAFFRRLDNIEAALIDAKKEREFYNNTISERFTVVSDRIQAISLKLEETSLHALEVGIYDSNSPSLRRMIKLISYIKRGADGNCLNFAIKDLILPNKELWQSLFELLNDFSDVTNKEAYLASLEKIKKTVLY
jgi:hypothetical protein